MKIIEIFKSIQGEGLYSGLPCVFVRFQGCNLNCSFCDSKYALEPHSEHYTIQELIRRIEEFKGTKTVVLTGGEPLFRDHGNLIRLCKALKDDGYQIHIETNGTIRVMEELFDLIDVWAVSPKISLYPELYTINARAETTRAK